MSLLASTWMLQPVLHPAHTLGCDFKNHTRCVYRNSLLHKAPTGHKSTTLPASLLFTGSPGKISISQWCPRLMTCNSAVPLISRVNRTQREHMMHRSVNSVI